MNNENLKPYTKDNAKYYGKIGGIKSGQIRNQRKSMKEQLNLLLSMKVLNKKKIEQLEEKGFKDDEINNQLLLVNTLFEKALIRRYKSICNNCKYIKKSRC